MLGIDTLSTLGYNLHMKRIPLNTDPELPLLLKPAPIFQGWEKRPLVGREKQLYLRNRYRVASVLAWHYDPHATLIAMTLYIKHGPSAQRLFK